MKTLEEASKAEAMLSPATCRECGSRHLAWHCDAKNNGGVQDGRIRMSEVGVIFYLGCDECSATVKVVDGDAVAALLTDLHPWSLPHDPR